MKTVVSSFQNIRFLSSPLFPKQPKKRLCESSADFIWYLISTNFFLNYNKISFMVLGIHCGFGVSDGILDILDSNFVSVFDFASRSREPGFG